jgi:hypothetical protein
MTSERGGPVSMSEDEVTAFLAEAPTGALCVVDNDGHLLALPSRVVDFDDATLTVEVGRVDNDAPQRLGTPACLVADTFTAYRAIRGIISQGTMTWPASRAVTQLSIIRTVTFSFANA